VIPERRRGQRIPVRQMVTISLGNGGHQVSAFSLNISSGGAFIYCDRFLGLESGVALILDLPPDITKAGSCRVWCEAKVVRIDQQLTEGKFGIALAFTSVQPLPEA
jgi:c-di-GMP-binding flagellar brake protein YcgR